MGRRIGWMWSAALTALAVAALLAVPAITQGEGEATFVLEPGSQNSAVAQPEVTLTVKIEDVTDLGAFEFELEYDPAVLTYKRTQPAGWLASTGRTVSCYTGRVLENKFQWGCTSQGPMAGVNGSGVAGTVVFTPKAAGVSPITCTKMELTAPDSPHGGIPTGEQCTGVIKVVSESSGGTGGGSGNNSGGSSNNSCNNRLEPTPTPNQHALTPTAIPNAPTQSPRLTLGTPEAGFDTSAPGSTGSSSSGAGSGSSGGSSGGVRSGIVNGVQAAGNFPVAGYGMAQDAVGRLSLWGQLTLLAGALTLATGAVLRVRRSRR